MDGFKHVGETAADERRRMTLGCAGVRPNDRFRVAISDDGQILLTPLVTMSRSMVRRLAIQQGVTEEQFLRGDLP